MWSTCTKILVRYILVIFTRKEVITIMESYTRTSIVEVTPGNSEQNKLKTENIFVAKA